VLVNGKRGKGDDAWLRAPETAAGEIPGRVLIFRGSSGAHARTQEEERQVLLVPAERNTIPFDAAMTPCNDLNEQFFVLFPCCCPYRGSRVPAALGMEEAEEGDGEAAGGTTHGVVLVHTE